MTDVLIMNGTGGSGKGTVAKYLRELFELKIMEYSSIDYVKSVATCTMEWNGRKDVLGRNLLSAVKQAMIAYNDLPTKKVIKEIEWANMFETDILIVDIREPDEIEKLVTYCALQKIQCVTCKVSNTLAEEQATRSGLSLTGDRLYGAYDYDVEIDNNGTMEELKENVFRAFEDVYNNPDEVTSLSSNHVINYIKDINEKTKVIVERGSNEKKPFLSFNRLKDGIECSLCGNDTGYYASYDAIICDYCGQRYDRK